MRKPVIEFQDFSFQYDSQSKPTLHNINLTIHEGEKVCIVGPSGSGKSTLVHCLNGLVPFAYKGEISGNLKINAKETRELDLFSISQTVGTVLQDTDGQFIGLTVAEDIAFSLENNAVPLREMKDHVQKAAELVQMSSHLNARIHELSGGQKQRVALAGVLVNDIEVVLFDEPLANLDPASGKKTMALIDKLQKESNKTIIIVEHRFEDVLSQPLDRIILMNHGQIIADVKPNEVLAGPLLAENWIREPLYIKALKYAGCELTKEMALTNVEELVKEAFQEKLANWHASDHSTTQKVHETESVLSLENISFHYPNKTNIIKSVSFKLHKGEMISLVGANGAGKSTLSSLICGFEKPNEGIIYFGNIDAKKDSIKERAQRVGFVLQNPNHMFSKQIVFEEVAFGLAQKNVSEAELKARVEDTLKVCGLYPFRNWPISALSYGQKKRLSIATILVMEPAIMLLDEPTAGQDYKHTTELMTFLEELTKNGIAIILITHDMHLMTEYTNRAIVLSSGEILADDSPAHILSNPELIKEANLKESSLYELAKHYNVSDPSHFVEQFIQYDREVRASEQRTTELY
ncbi:ATP-binding cassette domain-containing protein [Psychrobacillus glaciei]|uniref:ATP-binding cassette domain-containing protein n=1 Tax=Psychrobacillus glaciei TaxID=2283160 RepID=A0A5J6SRS1_9BACI|nr:ABC transporter ATP-binding protein [Psychrobacillus glaciei]QFG00696.1 ATP-binding cassette domain-containing protein [Psychrobacillus glaciei]